MQRLASRDVAALDPYRFMEQRVIHPCGRASTEALLQRAAITPESSVVDVGGGVATTAIAIAKRHRAAVTAVDIAPLMLERASHIVKAADVADRVSVEKGDILALPFADDSFDVVIAETSAGAGTRRGEPILASCGILDVLVTTRSRFYCGDNTKPLLLLAEGAYFEARLVANTPPGRPMGQDERDLELSRPAVVVGLHVVVPGQPVSTAGNADALVWGVMMVLTAGLILPPWIPGLCQLPRHLGVHRLMWRRQ